MRLADHTLVISRACDYERRARFTEQASSIGLRHWSFFDAIDAHAGQLSTVAPTEHGRHGRPSPGPLCAGELGCALSHLAIWRTCRSLGIFEVCVLEDDVEFVDPPTFWRRWDQFMASVPEDAAMLHLAGEEVKPPVAVNAHAASVTHTYGTSGLMLYGEAVVALAEGPGGLMREPADWLLLDLFATGRVYCPREPLMRHTQAPGITPR